jgi:glycosyltransferase involved in cell wall biosynthesis
MVGNGATVHALVRGAALAARGHAVRLVTLGDVLPAPPGLEVRTQPLPASLPAALRATRGFLRDVRGFRPDLLHVHYAGGRLGTLATLSGVRPMVVTVMGGDVQPEQHLGGYPRLERRATRRLLRQADLLLAKSDALRREIARYGDFEARTETVRWGIDVEGFARDPAAGRALRARLGLPPDARVVLSPRLLRPLYNVHLVVEAWPELRARVPGALLLLAGHRADEAYRAQLERRVAELGLADGVRFLGRIEYADMPALYSASDAVVSVPFSDGLPQTLFEALASSTPAVIGRLEAYEEVVRDGREALFSELEPGAIAAALARLLREPELAGRLTEAGLARVREVASLEREAGRVEGFYSQLLAGPRPRPDPLPLRLLDAATLLLR